MEQNLYYKTLADNIVLHVKVEPNSIRDEIIGTVEENSKTYLVVRIKASAHDGKANKNLLKFLATKFEMPVSNFKIKAGFTSRIKQILLCNKKGRLLPPLNNL